MKDSLKNLESDLMSLDDPEKINDYVESAARLALQAIVEELKESGKLPYSHTNAFVQLTKLVQKCAKDRAEGMANKAPLLSIADLPFDDE